MKKRMIRKIINCLVLGCCFLLGSASFAHAAETPKIAAKAAVLMDLDSGQILWEKNSLEALPPASTTKIVTAILALDMAPLDFLYTATPQASAVGESSIYLEAGQQFTVEELLRGALIPSGNDAAYALGEATAGSENLFIHWLNIKGMVLGATTIEFYNANGLPSEQHKISAYDLALITRYAMQNRIFAEIVKLPNDVIGQNETRRYLKNTNKLLSNEYVIGVKTGTTDAAGACLVAAMEKDGRRVLSVVFHSPDRFQESLALLNYGVENFYNINIAQTGDCLAIIKNRRQEALPLLAGNDGCFTLPQTVKKVQENWQIKKDLPQSYNVGEAMGVMNLTDENGQLWGKIELVSGAAKEQKGFFVFVENFIQNCKKRFAGIL